MSLKDLENQILFENFIQRIEEKIKTGRELIKQVANATTLNNYHNVIPDIESDVAKETSYTNQIDDAISSRFPVL